MNSRHNGWFRQSGGLPIFQRIIADKQTAMDIAGYRGHNDLLPVSKVSR